MVYFFNAKPSVSSASFLLFLCLQTVFPAFADVRTIAVEDKDYAPYYVWTDGKPTGPCIDIVSGTFALMGDTVEYRRFPWSRVLRSVEEQKVDAGLCGTRSEERAAYSHYPSEHLLIYDATLFVRADSDLQTSASDRLVGRSFGIVTGYSFGDIEQDLEKEGMIRLEATSRESLWNQLLIGRIDTALDSILPMVDDTTRMGRRDEIRALQPSLAETPGYLFFSRKPGNDVLAQDFSRALKTFKSRPEYLELKSRYGL
ncbi:substrate-binding periplasmic protein [Granulosicoccus sp. 3-233]|uniref:substrate-binding periplasmic protein n=1 Tax=Granulosicoccus sp. 3-233 TaxID=3417969 RepID=UPI003D333C94